MPAKKTQPKSTEFKLKVHGRTWRVVFDPSPESSGPLREGDNYGVTDRSKYLIVISARETRQVQAITFFHEFFHAAKTLARYNVPASPDVGEELDSDLIAYAMLEFMEQYPSLPKWFKEILKGER